MTAGQFHPRQVTMFRAPLTHPRWPMNRKQQRASGKARQQRSHGDTAEAVVQALKLALGHHRAGRLDEAARLCADVLARQPDQAVALHLLGVIRYQTGDARVAVELIRRATAAAPDLHLLGRTLALVRAAPRCLATRARAGRRGIGRLTAGTARRLPRRP